MISNDWTTSLILTACSAIVGALGCGQLADWLGRRMVIILCLIVTFGAITMEFVATTPELFFGGKFLNGFVVGALASVTVTYIGEVAPFALRGMLTCLTALAYTLGPLTVALIVNSTGTMTNRWAYRSVFCAQFGFAAIAAILVPFMPESPTWLVSKDRQEAALKALGGLGYKGAAGEKRLANINNTLEQIRKETEGVTYLECFRKSNLRRTIISIMPLSIQALSGVAFAASYFTYYMQLVGFSTEMSFKLQIVQQVLSLIGNIMSWYLVDRVGRRHLTFWGLVVLTVILFVMAGCAVAGSVPALVRISEPTSHEEGLTWIPERSDQHDLVVLLVVQRDHRCHCIHDSVRDQYISSSCQDHRHRSGTAERAADDVVFRSSLSVQP